MDYKYALTAWAQIYSTPPHAKNIAIDARVHHDAEYEYDYGGDVSARPILEIEVTWSTRGGRKRYKTMEQVDSMEQFIEQLTGDIDE